MRRLFCRYMWILPWCFVGCLLAYLIFRLPGYGWDFRVYRMRAADFIFSHANPYTANGWPYVYPPLTLYLFWPFAHLAELPSLAIWMFLKVCAFVAMVRVWHREFIKLDYRNVALVLFFVFAFNGAIFYDIESGNIAGFQQLALWIGFLQLLKGRPLIFGVIIAFIAQIKMDLMFFTVALCLVDERPYWKYFFTTSALFVFLYSLNALFFPSEFHDYQKILKSLVTYNAGVNNPSSLAFIHSLVNSPKQWYRPISLPDMTFFIYGLWAVGVILVSIWAYQRYRRRVSALDKSTIVMFLCIVFGMINPRVPPYLYPLLVLPSYFIFCKTPKDLSWPLAAILIALPRGDSSFPAPFAITFQVTAIYMQYVGLVFVWWAYCRYLAFTCSENCGKEATA